MRRADLTWLIVGGALGVVVVLGGLILLGGGTPALGLLLPLAVLGGGLLWAFDGARAAVLPDGAVAGVEPAPRDPADPAVRSAPPIVVSAPDAVDAPTVLPTPPPAAPEPDGESVSEAVRVDAARTFDLDRFLVDERPDRIQCAECGRYASLVPEPDRRVTCEDCGTTRALSEVQPDTRVRMFVETPLGRAAAPGSANDADAAGSDAPNTPQGG